MQSFYDYKKFVVLYVDDEEKSLKYFTRAFGDQFRILTALNAEEGFRIFEQQKDDIAILITDQRMPGEKGVQLLEKARQLRPRVIRILATAYSDIDAAIDAVNTGAIYKYVHKPWDVPQLEMTLKRAMEFFSVQLERDHLLKEKMSVLQNMMITDRVISLGVLAAGLSHHLRNSLVAVRTFIDLAPAKLREEKLDLEELRNPNFWLEFYTHVQGQVKRVTDLLNDIGAVAEKSPPNFKDKVQLQAVIAKEVDNVQSRLDEKRITVENNISASLPALSVDQTKFYRLFELLLKDELINLPNGSRISFNAEAVGQSIKLEVRDNGPGLPQDDLRSVFNPFFVRKENPQEFGVNLMTCYFIVYHHGGTVTVENAEGKGTVFTILLPTNSQTPSMDQHDREFVSKLLSNEDLWEKLLSGA